jgi:hypothetical protein
MTHEWKLSLVTAAGTQLVVPFQMTVAVTQLVRPQPYDTRMDKSFTCALATMTHEWIEKKTDKILRTDGRFFQFTGPQEGSVKSPWRASTAFHAELAKSHRH